MILEATGGIKAINFMPLTLEEEILQNVNMILSTPKGSVPLDRRFGINTTLQDTPIPLAQARMTGEIIEAVERYEPRVKVLKVTFSGDGASGELIPRVRLRIRES